MFPPSLFPRAYFPGAIFPALAATEAGEKDLSAPPLTLLVGGVARDAVLSTIRIRKPSNGIATLDCEIDSTDSSYRPALDDEVVFLKGSSREFGGFVVDVQESGLAGLPIGASITTHITAHGYAVRASRAVAQGIYPAATLRAKLEQLLADVSNPLPGITLHPGQASGPTLPLQAYDYVKTQEVLDEWSLLTGWPYEFDDNAVLRFVEPGTLSAAFNITDGDEQTIGDVTVAPTRTEYYNRVIVRSNVTGQVQDNGEITAHGLWALRVYAPPETDQAGVDALAAAILARVLPTTKRVNYQTYEDGVTPGRTQVITLIDRNINNTFLIGDVTTVVEGDHLRRSVIAIEGLVYQTGWREQFKTLVGGGGGGVSIAGFAGVGGTAVARFAYFLGGTGVEAVESPTPTWVPASQIEVQVNTIPRGTLSATVVVRLRALSAGVSVKARIFDLTDNVACPGESTLVTSTTFQLVTFTATLTAGSHLYRLEVLPGAANEPVVGVGYLE